MGMLFDIDIDDVLGSNSLLDSLGELVFGDSLDLGSQSILDTPEDEEMDLHQFMGEKTSLGDPSRAMTDILYGINHALSKGSNVGIRKGQNLKALTLLVRPQLNLRTRYMIGDRKMLDLLSNKSNSVQRYVRMTLDPRLGAMGELGKQPLTSKLIDNENAFIPLLTNTLSEITGWPDTVLPTSSTTPGIMKEEITSVSGTTDIFSKYDLDLTFKRIEGDPLLKMFETWIRYPSLTYLGVLAPYYDFILANEFDYMTRIYKLLLTPDGRYVKKIATTGASFPVSLPDGAEFNETGDEPFEDADGNVTIRFTNVGAIYNDPISVLNFNMTSSAFCPAMNDVNAGRTGHGMVQIPFNLNKKFNYRGKARIEPNTLELQFWIEKETLDTLGIIEQGYDALSELF